MSMSRDRVHFKIDCYQSGSDVRQAFMKAFGVKMPSGFPPPGQTRAFRTIICRPSQFARFLIYREEAGSQNLFKILEAKLVPANPEPAPLDVSAMPASGKVVSDDCEED